MRGGLTGAARPAGIIGKRALGRRGGQARVVHDGKGIAALVQFERQQPGLAQQLLVELAKRPALGAQQAALVQRVGACGEAANESTAQRVCGYAHVLGITTLALIARRAPARRGGMLKREGPRACQDINITSHFWRTVRFYTLRGVLSHLSVAWRRSGESRMSAMSSRDFRLSFSRGVPTPPRGAVPPIRGWAASPGT